MAAAPADTGAPDQARRFRELILPQLDAAYNLARYLARDPTLAEDIVQDAFLRAFRLFDSYRGGDPRAWLLAIVRNCWHDRMKGEQDRRRVLVDHAGLSDGQADAVENHPDPAGDPEAAAIQAHETQAIRAVIADSAGAVPRGAGAARDGIAVLSRDRDGHRCADRHRHVAPCPRAGNAHQAVAAIGRRRRARCAGRIPL